MGEPIVQHLSFNSKRRFGVELEILSFDKQNKASGNQMPKGTDYVTLLVRQNAEESVEARTYEHTSENNNCWVVKPDSSCGLEVCAPPLRGWRGIRKVCRVVDAFARDPKIEVDKRCSVHVHVGVGDLSVKQRAAVISYWVKCEPVFMDLVPNTRKRNRYCQLMGMTSLFEHDTVYPPEVLIEKVGEFKYFSLNTNQMVRNNRQTLEFRIIEGDGCKDPYLIKNWIRLLLHFVEMTSQMPLPRPYIPNDPWSSLLWLDTKDVLKVLGFQVDPPVFELSRGLTQTRNWMLARLMRYMTPDVDRGPRWKAYQELTEVIETLRGQGVVINFPEHLSPQNLEEALYGDGLRF
jgi:hypothetical protein